jgi:hypothetical protein
MRREKLQLRYRPPPERGPAADLAPVQKKANKKHRVGPRYESRGGLFGLLLGQRHYTRS